MARDYEEERRLVQPGVLPGERVAYWLKQRDMSVRALAEKVDLAESSVRQLIEGRTKKGQNLPEIARVLGLTYDYLYKGKGEPERQPGDTSLQELENDWPFPNLPRSKLSRLDEIELHFLESALLEALAKIESIRRSKRA